MLRPLTRRTTATSRSVAQAGFFQEINPFYWRMTHTVSGSHSGNPQSAVTSRYGLGICWLPIRQADFPLGTAILSRLGRLAWDGLQAQVERNLVFLRVVLFRFGPSLFFSRDVGTQMPRSRFPLVECTDRPWGFFGLGFSYRKQPKNGKEYEVSRGNPKSGSPIGGSGCKVWSKRSFRWPCRSLERVHLDKILSADGVVSLKDWRTRRLDKFFKPGPGDWAA